MKNIDKFLDSLKNVFGQRLKSVFMYGSCVKSGCENNVNLMILADDVTFDDLKNCSQPTRKWIGAGNPMPVFMSLCAWKFSNDTYAMEYADIKDNYGIIYGENYISDINIERSDLRLQCECETKNLLMRLRAFYLQNAHLKSNLLIPLKDTHKSLMTIFRTLLRLNYIQIPNDDAQVIALACNGAGISPEIFLKLLYNKDNVKKISGNTVEDVYSTLFKRLPELLEYVNSL